MNLKSVVWIAGVVITSVLGIVLYDRSLSRSVSPKKANLTKSQQLGSFFGYSESYVNGHGTLPQLRENEWYSRRVPRFEKVNYRGALLVAYLPIDPGIPDLDEVSRYIADMGTMEFDSLGLRVYGNLEEARKGDSKFWQMPEFIYAACLKYDIKTGWWDDPADDLSFSDLMEQTVEQNSNELIWVLLNTGEVKVFDPNDWRTIRPLLFVDCTDTDRSKAVRALRDTKEYPSLR